MSKKAKIYSASQCRDLDRHAIETIGIPAVVLMENAGAALADEVLKSCGKVSHPRIVIVCGTGNNGGDGFVCVRHLLNAGCKIRIFLAGTSSRLKKDAKKNYKILIKSGQKVVEINGMAPVFRKAVEDCDVIVDALFGVGLNRDIEEPVKSIVSFLNISKKKIVAADVPSGLDATNGSILGICVKAEKTVAFNCLKKGFFKNLGPKVTGKVIVRAIGMP